MTSIGMNLNSVNYWSMQFPFIDRFKSSGIWTAQGVPAGGSTTIPLDANGYPTGVPAGAADIYTMVALDPVSKPMTDTYVLTYSGEATFRPVGATVISSEPGKIVFTYTNTSSTMMPLMIYSINNAKPPKDIHIVRQDQVDLFNKGEIFNPEFLDKTKNWDTIRYMDWGNTNNSSLTSWSDRTTLQSASWAANSKNASVPIEVMVALANKTKTNMWLNIPAEANDDLVRKTMEYVRDNLDPTLKVNVEYSNEVWNFQFGQAKYAQAQADKLWGKDTNGDGINEAGLVGRGNFIYYGYRSAQVANIANQVFAGATDRVNTVISTQTVNTGGENFVFQGVAKAGLGAVSDLFDSYAITSYFGLGATSANDMATVLKWARSGKAGIDAAIQEILDGKVLEAKNSIADNVPFFNYQANIAAQNGLNLVSYEGGLELIHTNFPADQQTEIFDFYARLRADPRMAGVTEAFVGAFEGANGTLLNVFHDTGNAWATTDTIYDTSPTFEALVALANQAPSSTSLKTAEATYVMASGLADVVYDGSATAVFTATGNALGNTIIGGGRQSRLFGAAGNDILIGGTGSDSLNGGTGIDTMMGGLGNDIYVVDSAKDMVLELLMAGTDEVQTSLAAYTLDDNVENLSFTTAGVAAVGTGNNLANLLRGNSGNDTLAGGAGADTLMGGVGNDTYIVEDSGDVVVEAANAGVDTVRTTLSSYTLGAELEALAYAGASGFAGTGNGANNTITGGSGADTLDGGLGADRLIGGLGNDSYFVDNAGDAVIETANGGIDIVVTTLARYTLANEVESLTFRGTEGKWGMGNALDNVITSSGGPSYLAGAAGNDTLIGGAGADTLSGDAGADVMIGGNGDDSYYVADADDRIIEATDGGTDIVYTSVAYTLGGTVENLTITNAAGTKGTGNALDNRMTGAGGGDQLFGLDGKDTIYGRAGADTLDGGNGDDLLSGDDGDDLLIGGAGADMLIGSTGNDTLMGGAGADRLQGDAGADRYVFAPGDLGSARANTDTIFAFSSAEGDKIDLSAFDALLPKNVAQKFIGGGAFTRKAGEIRVSSYAGYLDVTGDLNGDGVADYSLTVNSKTGTLAATDFIL